MYSFWTTTTAIAGELGEKFRQGEDIPATSGGGSGRGRGKKGGVGRSSSVGSSNSGVVKEREKGITAVAPPPGIVVEEGEEEVTESAGTKGTTGRKRKRRQGGKGGGGGRGRGSGKGLSLVGGDERKEKTEVTWDIMMIES